MVMLAVTGWIPYLSAQCQGHVGFYRYIPLWPVLKTDATRHPPRGDIYPYWANLGHVEARAPFPDSWVKQASEGIPSAHAQS
jgi:hypothetical protein